MYSLRGIAGRLFVRRTHIRLRFSQPRVAEGMLELPQDARPYLGVCSGERHTADEAAEDWFAGIGRVAACVAGGLESVAEQRGEPFEIAGGRH